MHGTGKTWKLSTRTMYVTTLHSNRTQPTNDGRPQTRALLHVQPIRPSASACQRIYIFMNAFSTPVVCSDCDVCGVYAPTAAAGKKLSPPGPHLNV